MPDEIQSPKALEVSGTTTATTAKFNTVHTSALISPCRKASASRQHRIRTPAGKYTPFPSRGKPIAPHNSGCPELFAAEIPALKATSDSSASISATRTVYRGRRARATAPQRIILTDTDRRRHPPTWWPHAGWIPAPLRRVSGLNRICHPKQPGQLLPPPPDQIERHHRIHVRRQWGVGKDIRKGVQAEQPPLQCTPVSAPVEGQVVRPRQCLIPGAIDAVRVVQPGAAYQTWETDTAVGDGGTAAAAGGRLAAAGGSGSRTRRPPAPRTAHGWAGAA